MQIVWEVEWQIPERTAPNYTDRVLNYTGWYSVALHFGDAVGEHKTAASALLGLVTHVYPLTPSYVLYINEHKYNSQKNG